MLGIEKLIGYLADDSYGRFWLADINMRDILDKTKPMEQRHKAESSKLQTTSHIALNIGLNAYGWPLNALAQLLSV